MRLSAGEKAVLRALVSGSRLQSHRELDGSKRYCLHALSGDASEPVPAAVVERLRERGLIESNMKFPAATYLLTAKGEQAAASLARTPLRPLISRKETP
ncbi:MAG TPA: hypothetical protein VNK95_04630 [Caldilineaceae bacterium]|nr:hypothetical protein [Caldilineaceae bacterium]